MFYTLTNKRSVEFSPRGNPMRDVFELKRELDGNNHLIKTGEENLYEIIQSFKSQCTVENIVRRFENGDISALSRVQGMYIDATVLPSNLHEANLILNNARNIYNNLPVEDRKKYTTFDEFIANFGSIEKINSFLSSKMPQNASKTASESISTEEVTNNE